MNRITANLSKIVLSAFVLLAIGTVYAKSASATRYAIAYYDLTPTCTGNPGNQCGGGTF